MRCAGAKQREVDAALVALDIDEAYEMDAAGGDVERCGYCDGYHAGKCELAAREQNADEAYDMRGER
jgi:hypothetical protein